MTTLGYPIRQHKVSARRYVQTLDLRDDPALIAEYRKYHSREGIWPEILSGIREAGVLAMDIFLLDTRLVMIVELDACDNWNEVMARVAQAPRQSEWEAFVARFQQTSPAASSTEKWQPMERIFELYEE